MDIFGTGERQDGHDGPVLNERAVRAGAGLLFLAAFIGFMNAWLLGDLRITRWFVLVFVLDMALRVLVHPRWAPSLVLGQWIVRGQVPEWVSATPKRFAWAIGASMICLCLVFFHPEKFAGALNALTRHALLPTTEQYLPRWLPLVMVWLCLGFMWLEAILGFCVGCKIHALLVKLGVLQDPCEACNNLDFG